jgi:DNA polymerase
VTIDAIAEDLYARVRGCTRCALARTRTLAVPGEGPLDAEVMFIGEAPGANEDKQGRPFVGAAGQFLEELLAAGGLTRPEVYICNILKCRPPSNRDPLPGEIEACNEYLDEQIDLIDPLVIVTLGRFSMGKFFPNQSISRIHGRPRESAGRFYVPMYHPAAALHQGSLRQVMLQDFSRLPELIARARRSRDPDPTVAIEEPTTPPPPAVTQLNMLDVPAPLPSVSGNDLPPPPIPGEPAPPEAPRQPGQIRLFE